MDEKRDARLRELYHVPKEDKPLTYYTDIVDKFFHRNNEDTRPDLWVPKSYKKYPYQSYLVMVPKYSNISLARWLHERQVNDVESAINYFRLMAEVSRPGKRKRSRKKKSS